MTFAMRREHKELAVKQHAQFEVLEELLDSVGKDCEQLFAPVQSNMATIKEQAAELKTLC